MTDNATSQRAVPSVSVTYARSGASTKANVLGIGCLRATLTGCANKLRPAVMVSGEHDDPQ